MKKTKILGVALYIWGVLCLSACHPTERPPETAIATVEETTKITTNVPTETTEETSAVTTELIIEATTETTTEETTVVVRTEFKPSEEVVSLLKEASNWDESNSMAGNFNVEPIYVDSEIEVYAIGSRYTSADVGVYFYDKVNNAVYKDDWTASGFESEVAKYKYDKENGLFYTYIDYLANGFNHLGLSVFNIKSNVIQDQCFIVYNMYGETILDENGNYAGINVEFNTMENITTPQELVAYADTLNLVDCTTIYED